MPNSKRNYGLIALRLLLAVLMHKAAAQTPTPAQSYLKGAAEAGYTAAANEVVPERHSTARDLSAAETSQEQSGARADGLATSAVTVGPQHQSDTEVLAVVRVTGLRAVPWKSYGALRAALAAYDKYKFLAPQAVFSFAVLPSTGKPLPPNFKLRVRAEDGQEFPVALQNHELFQLPVLPNSIMDADLVSNLKEGQLRIGLLVHTPSVPPEKERLGDVRLRSLISQAIADVDHPSDDPRCMRKRHLNGCRPPHVSVWHTPRAPTNGASIVEGNRRQALESNGDPNSPSYKMPISGGHWGNDAIIQFDYRTRLRPLKLSEVAIYEANDEVDD
jgi:hypothetical protein